eukprot:8067279-Lingulodinium_polyedra.AAC.1
MPMKFVLGDLNADVGDLPSLSHSVSNGEWLDLGAVFGGSEPAVTCRVNVDAEGTRRDYAFCARAAAPLCRAFCVDPDGGFAVHLPVSVTVA